MKFVILCPFGFRTGGPEACYQLSDMLLRQGFAAELWLLTDEDVVYLKRMLQEGNILAKVAIQVPPRENSIDEYARYRTRSFSSYTPGEEVTFVLPEVYAWMVPLLLGNRTLLWWLSVDNAFHALAGINLNLLRMRAVHHAVQSAYADRFVRALGLTPTPLSDYTVVPDEGPPLPLGQRPLCVAVNAGHKVIANVDLLTKAIQQACPSAEVVHIANMTRGEVSGAFGRARVFIDLGKLPGKDRMPREALLMGANLIVGSSGSGAFPEDFPVPEPYRPDPFDLDYVARLSVHMLLNPDAHVSQFEASREMVAREQACFGREVLETFTGFFRA